LRTTTANDRREVTCSSPYRLCFFERRRDLPVLPGPIGSSLIAKTRCWKKSSTNLAAGSHANSAQ
jgi:hypothetical protein